MRAAFGLALMLAAAIPLWSASKPHVVFLGKPQTVKIFVGADESQPVSITVRPLYVDGKVKDYTTSDLHDVTDRTFVVQLAFRLNDWLPGDPPKQTEWVWQRGDWLLVDRSSGHVVPAKLPDFDAAYSHVSWYRDYAAYCSITGNGTHWSAVVAQLGVRKALFHKNVADSGVVSNGAAVAECPPPKWERHPPRVTFAPPNGQPFTVNVVARHAEELIDDQTEE
jgi:hypothetical protein